jgi:hypothetical protein
MFSNLNNKKIQNIVQEYKTITKKDRNVYINYYEYLNGNTDKKELILLEINKEAMYYKFISTENIFITSNKLINDLYLKKYIDYEYLKLTCFAQNYIYKIFIKNRLLCEIININFNHIDIFNVIKDDKYLELSRYIVKYKTIYNLTNDDIDFNNFEYCKMKQNVKYNKHINYLSMIKYNDFIIINIIHDQINLSSNTPKDLVFELIEILKQGGINEVKYKKNRVNILFDIRLKKYNIYIGKRIVFSIFNNAKYELIPYYEHEYKDINFKVATKVVSLTFIYIYLFTIKLMYNNKYISKEQYLYNKKEYKYVLSNNKADKNVDEFIDNIKFYGFYFNDNIYLKKIVKNIKLDNKKYGDYYPYIYEKDNSELRLL